MGAKRTIPMMLVAMAMAMAMAGTVVWGAEEAPGLDRQAMLQILNAQYEKLDGLSCEYKGESECLDAAIRKKNRWPDDAPFEQFSGSLKWKANGLARLESYSSTAPDHALKREILVIRGSKSEIYFNPGDPKKGAGFVEDSAVQNLGRPGSLGVIFLVDWVRWIFSNLNLEFQHEGSAEVDGHPCEVVAFSFPRKGGIYQRLWIDMNRGGHVLKREGYANAQAVSTRSLIQLVQVKRASGDVWLPRAGTVEGFTTLDEEKQTVVHGETPWKSTRLDLLMGTVQFDPNMSDQTFTLNYRPGTPISDALTKSKQRYEEQPIPVHPGWTRSEADRILDEQLKATEEQRKAIEASTSYREPWNPSAWLLTILGAGTLTAVVFLRRGGMI